MQLYLSELPEPGELSAIIRETGCGLETIMFSISENLDNYAGTMRREKELLRDMGNPPVTVHGPFLDLNPMTFDSRIRQVVMDRFAQAYEAAEELGADRVIYHSGMVPSVYYLEGWAERMIDFWEDFLPGRTDVTVCMENVLDPEIWPFRQTAEELCPRWTSFGICLDIGHAHCYSRHSAMEWAEQLRPYIRHIHLHDNDGSWDHHLALGEGTAGWEEILALLAGENAELTGTIECASGERIRRSLAGIGRIL